MRQALYRKYRSNDLSDIVGQEPIVATLLNAIKENKISHAYLFTGPRGVGKTSVARIIAHNINKLNYINEDNHIDIIEIDGASNRGIEEIRDLREKTSIAPTSSEYKVYIIDEVHMLTNFAFNALLKILEEPPKHIIFILATTDVNKVPATIISRTQKFTFKQIPNDVIVKRLSYICQKEKIDIEIEALEIIAENSEGSLRDSINMLDQLASNSKKITADDVANLIGLPPESKINLVIEGLLDNTLTVNKLFMTLDELFEQGTDAKTLSKTLVIKLKEKLILDDPKIHNQRMIIELLKNLLNIPGNSSSINDQIKVILADNIIKNFTPNISSKKSEEVREVKIQKTSDKEIVAFKDEEIVPKKQITEKSEKKTPPTNLEEAWAQVINYLKKSHSTLYSTLMMSQTVFEKNTIEVTFNKKFYADQFNNAKNHEIIRHILLEIDRPDISITAQYNKDLELPKKQSRKNDIIEYSDNIKEIFGEAELINDESINLG